ncbi:2Fe-2S iron-sulfur cluster-binding protein [Nitrincola sp. A-D6]|uniref:2Fe-2S iron-sulfur cluster-binding protein n=1 Tax=Nitrincola sp. A-D6 TaxID=1545442 RepID=UPI002E15FDE6
MSSPCWMRWKRSRFQPPTIAGGGYCGTCKVRLLDGQVEPVQDALVDLKEDEILTCCCRPTSHIEIELPD